MLLLVLLLGAPLTFAVARIKRGHAARASALLAFALFSVAFLLAAASLGSLPTRTEFLGRPLEWDAFAAVLALLATGLGAAASLASLRTLPEEPGLERFHPLMLLAAAGAVGVGLAGDLFTLYVFFELMAVASYGLVAYHTSSRASLDAGLRYLTLSAAGSLTALFGIALVYLFAGSLEFPAIALRAASVPVGASLPAIALLIVGFGVKAALVPLQAWAPSAYLALPSPAAALLAGAATPAGALALAKAVTAASYGSAGVPTGIVLAVLAVITMTAGNLWALREKDLKRMLAYSSVSQAGVILLGVALWVEYGASMGLQGSLVQVLGGGLSKGGAFLAAGALIAAAGSSRADKLEGAGRRAPLASLAFALFVLSLAGLPPLPGFWGKFLIARGGLDAGTGLALFLVVVLALNSVLSLGTYIPWLNRIAFGAAPNGASKHRAPLSLEVPAFALAAIALLLSLFPDLPIAIAARIGVLVPGQG